MVITDAHTTRFSTCCNARVRKSGRLEKELTGEFIPIRVLAQAKVYRVSKIPLLVVHNLSTGRGICALVLFIYDDGYKINATYNLKLMQCLVLQDQLFPIGFVCKINLCI